MTDVFVEAYNIISPLGRTAGENYAAVMQGQTGVKHHTITQIHNEPFYAAVLDSESWNQLQWTPDPAMTHFECMLLHSIQDALKGATVTNVKSADTVLIISTTKGNIGLLEQGDANDSDSEMLSLHASARKVAAALGNPNEPVVISNACISGVTALLYASRLISSGTFRHAVVAGADTFTRFVFSGFRSFQAISVGHCKPFSASRDGINLGEAAATMILSRDASNCRIKVMHGAVTNDSNHISGPSRTGDELAAAIIKTLDLAGARADDIAFISAHGTATPYNDEMEAKAFRTAGLEHLPVNSLKGCFGHTLGAAGLVESVISIMSFENNQTPPTHGFDGVPVLDGLQVSDKPVTIKPKPFLLKTASGFGGCNAAILFGIN